MTIEQLEVECNARIDALRWLKQQLSEPPMPHNLDDFSESEAAWVAAFREGSCD
jgi:hypothetical protein